MPGRRRAATGDPLAHLAKSGPRPVYAVHGPERVLVDEAVSAIKTHALPATGADFNFDVFVGRDATATKIADAARMLPAFAERRMVLVKDADKLTTDTCEGLLAYLKDPSPTTVLLFVAAKFDGRTKFFKALKKAGAVIEFGHPTARQMPALVRQRATKIGAKIEPDAVQALVDAVGADVGAVVAALEKLALYVGDEDRAIARSDVESVVSHVREESIYALSDAVVGGDPSRALELVHEMLSGSREHPLALLGLIAGHWRRLTIARTLMDDRASRGEIQSALGMPPFVTDKILR